MTTVRVVSVGYLFRSAHDQITRYLRFDQVLGAAVEAVFVRHRRHDRAVGRDRRADVRLVVVVVTVDTVVFHLGHPGRRRRRAGRFRVPFRVPVRNTNGDGYVTNIRKGVKERIKKKNPTNEKR